jgi:hypothetical protein
MPTRRRQIRRGRLETEVPQWALDLLEGKNPRTDGWVDWVYFGERIPGLPAADSPEGKELIARVGGIGEIGK